MIREDGMHTLDDYRRAGEDLYHKLHLATYPIAITYLKEGEEVPHGTFRPSKGGKKLALCQAFTLSRSWGMAVAMTAQDNFCTPATAFHGWSDISKEDLIESQVKQGWHKDWQAEERRVEGAWKLLRSRGEAKLKKRYGFVCAPLKDAPLIPDTVLAFGDGVQITHMIHALCYEYQQPMLSFFEGFGESCVKGGLLPFLLDSPQLVLPGMGDRSFAAIGAHELALGLPAHSVFAVLENLFKTGGAMNMGYPAKGMLAMDITENITPGFTFLRDKMNAKQD